MERLMKPTLKIVRERDPREVEIERLRKEIRAEREHEHLEAQARTDVRKKEAEGRLKILNKRLKDIGLRDLFSTGVHTVLHKGYDGYPEIWACIDGSMARDSEKTANKLLDRLEKIAKK
jgi:hypothetical protein